MDERAGMFRGKAYYPLVFLCYFGLFAALFPDVLFLGNSFAKRDILRFYYPVWHFSVDCLKQGIFPLWNPYNSFGAPFFADIQTCVLYPLSLILHLPDYLLAFNLYILVHLALSGLFTCVWMRDCGASREAAFLSGIAFSLSGYVMSVINLTISLCSLVYFPLFLLCLRRAFRGGGIRWKAAGAAVLLCQYLAGDPAMLFSTVVVGMFFTVFRTAADSARKKKLVPGAASSFAQTGALFLGLSAFHTLLFAEFLRHSNRANPTYADVTVWSMQLSDLASLVLPFFSDNSYYFMDYWTRQSWLESPYAGITVVILAWVAWKLNRSDLVGYHVLLALFGIGLAMGRFSLLHQALYEWFPFFKYIRYPVRFSYVTYFALACLAGFGLDALLAKMREPRPALRPSAALALASGVLGLTAAVIVTMTFSPRMTGDMSVMLHGLLIEWTENRFPVSVVADALEPVLDNVKRCAVLAALLGIGVLAALRFKPRKWTVVAFVTLLVFADLSETNLMETKLEGKYLEKTGKHMQVLIEDKSIFRAQSGPSAMVLQLRPMPLGMTFEQMHEVLIEALTPNMLLPHRVSYASGYDSIYLMRPLMMNGRGAFIKDPVEYKHLNMMNLKYVVSRQKDLDPSYRLIQHAGPTYLYENTNFLPRAFLVPAAAEAPPGDEALDKIISTDFDPEALVYLEGETPASSPAAPPAGNDEVRIVSYLPNEVRMDVSSSAVQWLFLSDSYYPGWKAEVDGTPTPIRRANYAFRAVSVEPGRHEVVWKYDPILFKIGCMISALTAFGMFAMAWRGRGSVPR